MIVNDHSEVSEQDVLDSLSKWQLTRPPSIKDIILECIEKYHAVPNGSLPTISDISGAIGKPRTTVSDNLVALVKEGFVLKLEDRYLLNANKQTERV